MDKVRQRIYYVGNSCWSSANNQKHKSITILTVWKSPTESCRCSCRRIVAIKRQIFCCFKKIVCFFAASPHRWDVLLKHASIALKRVIDRRWNAYHATVKAFRAGFDRITGALEQGCPTCGPLSTH